MKNSQYRGTVRQSNHNKNKDAASGTKNKRRISVLNIENIRNSMLTYGGVNDELTEIRNHYYESKKRKKENTEN
jgi:hypothetical protein